MMRSTAMVAAGAILASGVTGGIAAASGGHGDDMPAPRWTTRICPNEDSNNCFWDAGNRGNERGHSFWAIPVGRHTVAVVYWDRQYNRSHGYITNR